MTLRRTLLLAFIVLGLLPSAALSWLSFSRTRATMTAQIRQSLAVQARGIQTDIDSMLFERFQNARVWSRSELMQDLRLADVDKRVTNDLVGLQLGYRDVYREIDCRTAAGVVVASSNAARIGSRLGPPAPVALAVRLADGEVRLALPSQPTLDDRAPISIETDIALGYTDPATPPTRLHLDFDARQISRLLDAAAVGHRAIVVVDGQGRWVAGSAALRGRLLPDADGRAAMRALAGSTSTRTDAGLRWIGAPALVGRAHALATPTFPGSGWTTLVFEPVDEALAPVSQMAVIFAGLLLAVLLATLALATWIAGAIAQPIVALTDTTRRYRQGELVAGEAPVGSRIVELDVLGRAFADMVTAVEQSRRELVRTSKMAMLGELAAVLAHEVRTPLGILRSSAQILMRNPGLGAEGLELMGFIESETERLNGLVSTLLDTARPRPPARVRCDLHALLRRCAQMHDLRRGGAGEAHPVELRFGAGDPWIDIDAEQLMQVIFNLLNNAAQAAGPAGRVRISTFEEPGVLGLEIGDDGAGIPPELAERLFEPFVSGRAGGIGLGLAVVRQVVLAHAGQVSAGRSPLGGAAVTVRLPRRTIVDPRENQA